jgi:hypothetical protein
VYQNNEMAAILVYGTGISSFLFKYFVLFHHPTGATDHVSENDLFIIASNRTKEHIKPGFHIVVTVVKIKSRSFSLAEIQHLRTENTRSDYNYIENTYDLYVVYRNKLL